MPDDAVMAEMMKQLEEMMANGGDQAFDSILDGMMDQLMTRELLHEPMKVLSDKVDRFRFVRAADRHLSIRNGLRRMRRPCRQTTEHDISNNPSTYANLSLILMLTLSLKVPIPLWMKSSKIQPSLT